MSKKDNNYKMKNKEWSEKEIKQYLTEFLHGFDIQSIAAGPAVMNKNIEDSDKHEQYLRQQHSVDEKLKDYMRETLKGNLIIDANKWGTLFFICGINTICSMVALTGLPSHVKIVQGSINILGELFKTKAAECIIDLVSSPDQVVKDPKDNVYTHLVDEMLKVLTNEGFIKSMSKRGSKDMMEFLYAYTSESSDVKFKIVKDD